MLYFTAVVEVNLDPIPKMIFDFFFDGLVSICYGPALGSSNFELAHSTSSLFICIWLVILVLRAYYACSYYLVFSLRIWQYRR